MENCNVHGATRSAKPVAKAVGADALSDSKTSVAVVGGGVIGLTVANELSTRDVQVDVFSPQPVEQTTSATAAAFWAPYWVGDYPRQWAAETLGQLQQFAEQQVCGVGFADFEEWMSESGYEELQTELGRDDVQAAYWWRDLPGIGFGIESIDPPKTLSVPPHGPVRFTRKVRFRTVVARMTDYLAFLQQRACDGGRVRIVSQWVDDLAALTNRYDAVFHCTGWGAKRLCGHDPSTRQMRLLAGLVCRVETSQVDRATLLHRDQFHETPLYIVPRHGTTDDVICGGTAIEVEETHITRAHPIVRTACVGLSIGSLPFLIHCGHDRTRMCSYVHPK